MTAVLNFTRSLEDLECFDCGIIFGVGSNWVRSRRDDKKTFWCPNGHSQAFLESEREQLRKKLETANQQLMAKESALKTQRERAEAADAAALKLQQKLKRVKNGVCPCCKRSFTALQRHIKTKHPEWKP